MPPVVREGNATKVRYPGLFRRSIHFDAPLAISAQEFRGAISGAVTDATGSTVAGAKITVTETNTNTRIETATEPTGQYTAPFLLPGDYEVSVRMAGFKEFVRKGIHVGAG